MGARLHVVVNDNNSVGDLLIGGFRPWNSDPDAAWIAEIGGGPDAIEIALSRLRHVAFTPFALLWQADSGEWSRGPRVTPDPYWGRRRTVG